MTYDQCPWQITSTALREYLHIAGLPDTDEGWSRASAELIAHCATARAATHDDTRSIYRSVGKVTTGDRAKRTRLEYTVCLGGEITRACTGDRPQLVRVRDKGRGHRDGRPQ